jgi:hypothetical protein
MSVNFPVQADVEKGDALLPLLFNFAIRKVQRKPGETEIE